jgi:AraC-like DNA-binding protein
MVLLTASSTDEWQDIASRTFVPLQCESPAPAFRGSVEIIRLSGGISVCDVSSRATVITRTSRLAAGSASDDLYLSLQVRSHGVITQGSSAAEVRPGSVAVYASHIPHRLDYSHGDQRQLVVQIPRLSFDLPPSTLDAAAASIGVADSSARKVFFSYVSSLTSTHDEIDEPARDDFARVTADLAATMLRSAESGHRLVPGSPRSLLVTIQSFIREESRAADLTLDDIARAHFISRRKLYDLFSQIHTTPSAYIRDERLRLASRMLVDPRIRLPISDIAQHCGFADVTTFTRAFRKRFDMTPREWRAGR